MAARRRGVENMSIITNVNNFETLLEQYFVYHSNFLWDKAKEFLESEREKLKSRHPNCGTSIIVALLNSLYQLNLAEKNYMQLQFFSQKFLQRKDIVKLEYSSLKYDFQQLEQRGTLITYKNVSITATQTSPIHSQNISTPTKCLSSLRTPTMSVETSPIITHQLGDEIAQDALNCTTEELFQPDKLLPTLQQASPRLQALNDELSSSRSPGFFSKLFRFTSKSSSSQTSTLKPLQESDLDSSQIDPGPGLCQENHFELESVEKFVAHVAGHLVKYVSMRIDMIRWFETLADVCSANFCLVDGCIQTLRKIQQEAEQNFHHPVFSSLKMMFYFECDILLGLLNLHTTIQNFKYLESLFYLQDAHNKLNLIATLRDQMLTQVSGSSSTNQINTTIGNGFQDKLRRNITSSSLASSIGSSSGGNVPGVLQVPPLSAISSGPGLASGLPSPSGLASTGFVYPYPNTGIYIQPKFSQRHNSFTTMPPLFQWLNGLKQFLLSKYSFYFHSVLLHHLSTGVGVQEIMKPLSKQSYDFHHRNVTFLKKFDNTQLVLLFDTHEKECNLSGYCSPYIERQQPHGVSSIQVIYCHPGEFSLARLPSLIKIMGDKTSELNNTNQVVIVDGDKQRHLSLSRGNNAIQQAITPTTQSHITYFLFRSDPDFTLAIICEGHRRPDRDIVQIVHFLQETCSLLKGTKIFTNLKTAAK